MNKSLHRGWISEWGINLKTEIVISERVTFGTKSTQLGTCCAFSAGSSFVNHNGFARLKYREQQKTRCSSVFTISMTC